MNGPSRPLGALAVFDIETAPDPFAVALAPKGGAANRPALHRLTGWSLLTATESDDLTWTGFGLQTRSGDDEYEMLFDLDAALTTAQEANATLVTYNGIAHDLPTLRRRLIANWLFGLPGMEGAQTMPHRDLMREATRGQRSSWPSLRDLCAACGVPTDHMVAATAGETASAAHRKSQVDVAATFLLLAHEESARRGESRTVSRAWLALASFLKRPGVLQPHLTQFHRHPMLQRAASEAELD